MNEKAWIPILSGVKDSINPYSFVNVLIFFIFISTYGFDQKRVFRLGLFFVLSVFTGHALLIFGFFDSFLSEPFIKQGFRILHIFMPWGFVILGVINFLDWYRLRIRKLEYKFFLLELPVFLSARAEGIAPAAVRVILAFLIGLLCAFLASEWPMNIAILFSFYLWLTSGYPSMAYSSIVVYSFLLVVPLFLVWFIILELAKKKERLNSNTVVSIVKIVAASLFLATGAGLILK